MAKSATVVKLPRKSTLARQPANPQARNTVTVACKLPHGLVLRVFRKEEYSEQGRDGRLIQNVRHVETGRFVLKGANAALGHDPKMPFDVAFALTSGVPAEIWDRWLEENRESDMVRNGLVFAADTTARAADQARERAGLRTGFEPIDPKNPGAHVRGIEEGAKKAA